MSYDTSVADWRADARRAAFHCHRDWPSNPATAASSVLNRTYST